MARPLIPSDEETEGRLLLRQTPATRDLERVRSRRIHRALVGRHPRCRRRVRRLAEQYAPRGEEGAPRRDQAHAQPAARHGPPPAVEDAEPREDPVLERGPVREVGRRRVERRQLTREVVVPNQLGPVMLVRHWSLLTLPNTARRGDRA